jgi:hypothetical protein
MDLVDYTGKTCWIWWTTEMDMVDYTDRHGGLRRWTWWTTEMDMGDYTDGHGKCPAVG